MFPAGSSRSGRSCLGLALWYLAARASLLYSPRELMTSTFGPALQAPVRTAARSAARSQALLWFLELGLPQLRTSLRSFTCWLWPRLFFGQATASCSKGEAAGSMTALLGADENKSRSKSKIQPSSFAPVEAHKPSFDSSVAICSISSGPVCYIILFGCAPLRVLLGSIFSRMPIRNILTFNPKELRKESQKLGTSWNSIEQFSH